MEFNASEVKDRIVEWIRNWFEENGRGCCAVLGISGGKDSSVTAALCVEALGRDRVVGVLMPNGEQFDIG
ncbi:MAG: NAD(+) synthase, partial [Aristaeellaceae bacterium]